jgi:serine/threonine protein kinase
MRSANLAAVLLGGRFEIRRRLGEGGMGVVYEALDQKRNLPVALKTVTRLDASGLYRLKAEFRALAGVVHPNLVRLHDLVADADGCFFTMDLVPGRPFLDHVREDSSAALARTQAAGVDPALDKTESAIPVGGRFLEEPLRDALRQLAAGVAAIHAEKKLHRDLKPSNVLVTPEGRLVILDFGLVSTQAERPIGETAEEVIAGTPAYMAPEQVDGGAVPASDWYAVGVMLYEALTGELPFTGSMRQILAAKLTKDPPSPAQRCSGVPQDLDALCRSLLAPDAAHRSSGDAILRVLGHGSGPLLSSSPADTSLFLGRSQEMRRLEDALPSSGSSAPALVLVCGPSGVGKTVLVQRFLSESWASGALTLAGRCYELAGRCYERELIPFKALDGIVDALGRHLRTLPAGAAGELIPRDVHALARLFPTLRRVDAIANTGARGADDVDQHTVRRRAFHALKELFTKLCDRQSVVVFIDDLQWADADSAALLEALMGLPEPPPVLYVASYRDEEEESEVVRRVSAPQGSSLDVQRIRVGPLGAPEPSPPSPTVTVLCL